MTDSHAGNGLKGQQRIAQGNALGKRAQTGTPCKGKSFMAALAVALLACSCAHDDEPAATTGQAIAFDATVKAADTRAGETACMDNDVLLTTGFGVFSYSEVEGFTSWLNNTKMTYSPATTDPLGTVHIHPSNWSYASQKDWPAKGTISFFAYAPYVSAGVPSVPGITAIAGDGTLDPTVSYQVSDDVTKCVDLLWDVKGATGLPWLDATAADNPIVFNFRHALAAVGFRAQVMVDKDNNLTDFDDISKTGKPGTTECKVTIKSITLTCTDGSFYKTGTLHLNNKAANQPVWDSFGEEKLNNFTLSGSAINAELLAPSNYEANITTLMSTESTVPGITETANKQMVISKNAKDKEQCWMFIPQDDKTYQLKVEYYVTYKTSDTPTYNTFEYTEAAGNAATIDIGTMDLKPDTKYYFNLVFGLKTLQLSVTAEDWADAPVNTEVVIERGTSASSSLARYNIY